MPAAAHVSSIGSCITQRPRTQNWPRCACAGSLPARAHSRPISMNDAMMACYVCVLTVLLLVLWPAQPSRGNIIELKKFNLNYVDVTFEHGNAAKDDASYHLVSSYILHTCAGLKYTDVYIDARYLVRSQTSKR